MGHNEAPVGIFVTDRIVLTDQTSVSTTTSGTLICSGQKLQLFNGTSWEVVTSA